MRSTGSSSRTASRRSGGQDSELLRNLVAEGDLPGALWKQGLFEGAGPRFMCVPHEEKQDNDGADCRALKLERLAGNMDAGGPRRGDD